MNKEDRVQLEREVVRVSTEVDTYARAGKTKKENKAKEELYNLVRHLQ